MTGQKHIFSLETLFRMTYDLHKAGKTIGITHGAFDLFHVSHVDLLQKSSKLCDFLVVGVESDEHVAAYKSYKRPIISDKDRLKIVSEMHCVDAVFLNTLAFTSETYTLLYKELHANIVTIGKHYAYREKVQEQAEHANSTLREINTLQLASTTEVIDTILLKYARP